MPFATCLPRKSRWSQVIAPLPKTIVVPLATERFEVVVMVQRNVLGQADRRSTRTEKAWLVTGLG